MGDDFLLRLYRLARESGRGEFQPAAISLLRQSLDFGSAFWGEGEVRPGSAGAVLRSAYFDEVDPQFVSQWKALHYRGRVIPVAVNDPGRALEVRTAHFYAAEPERAELYEQHRMRSYSFISDFAPDGIECCWLNLYRPDPDASGARDDLARVQQLMPHLGEAWRTHRAIHAHDSKPDREDELGAVVHRPAGVIAGSVVSSSAMRPKQQLPITARQHEVAVLYARGCSHKEVAGALDLSPATVRNHLAAVYGALRVHTRRELFRALEPDCVRTCDGRPRQPRG